MKKGFKDPIAPNPSSAKVKTPWNFEAPIYDERCKVAAGDNYGVGFRNPVGHKGSPKMHVDTMPVNKVLHMRSDDIPRNPLDMRGSRAKEDSKR